MSVAAHEKSPNGNRLSEIDRLEILRDVFRDMYWMGQADIAQEFRIMLPDQPSYGHESSLILSRPVSQLGQEQWGVLLTQGGQMFKGSMMQFAVDHHGILRRQKQHFPVWDFHDGGEFDFIVSAYGIDTLAGLTRNFLERVQIECNRPTQVRIRGLLGRLGFISPS